MKSADFQADFQEVSEFMRLCLRNIPESRNSKTHQTTKSNTGGFEAGKRVNVYIGDYSPLGPLPAAGRGAKVNHTT